MNESITADLFATLDTVVAEQMNDGCFRIIGTVPEWFKQFYPNADLENNRLMLGEKFTFLENFIIDAENFWQENQADPLKSGLWVEVDASGKEFYLEASAIKLKNKKILLISLGELATLKDKQSLIQKGRETSLNYYNLLKEIQSKEILIHCIIHDLAGQLTGINYCFELLGFQELTPKGKQYLESGRKQAKKQEILIREILDAFSAEVESLENFTADPTQAPNALVCASEVIDALSPNFSLNQMNLQLSSDIDQSADWRVVGERLRLYRVLSNLVENAFRHSPPGSTVTVDLKQDGEFILITVDDQGCGVPLDSAKSLFQKFSQGKDKPGRIGLGLYFCRITVERWGGSIGYSPLEPVGSRFWFRLPKPVL